jgi:hypothetical protein
MRWIQNRGLLLRRTSAATNGTRQIRAGTRLPRVIWRLSEFASSSALIKTRNLRSENVLPSANINRR